MRRRLLLTASMLAFAVVLAGCESFDPTDFFNRKKPLTGERQTVFPEGVPGVPQGVPPELVKGYQPPPEPPPPPPKEQAKAEKPKPKPKPKKVATPKPVKSAPGAAPWPDAPPPPPATTQRSTAPAPWPDTPPPAPGAQWPAQPGQTPR